METNVLKTIGFSAGIVALISVVALVIIAQKTYLETVRLKLDITKLKRELGLENVKNSTIAEQVD